MRFTTEESNVKAMGRTLMKNGVRYLNYSCSAIEFVFTGKKAEAVIWSDLSVWEKNLHAWLAVFVDEEEEPSKRFLIDREEAVYTLYEGDIVKETKIRLVKYSEVAFAKVGIKEIITDTETAPRPTASKERKIEFIGDSITCGYGNEGKWMVDVFNTAQENPWKAYAARTARALDAEYHLISWSGIGIISNWTDTDVPKDDWLMPGMYPYTDKACDLALGNKDPEVWDNNRFIPDCIVINLGTNDNSYTRNIPERVEVFGNEYYNFVKTVRSKNPSSKILCTLGAMGQDLCSEVERQVQKLNSEGDADIMYMPFELQKEEDGLGTDWHPTLITHEKMKNQLEKKLRKVMNW